MTPQHLYEARQGVELAQLLTKIAGWKLPAAIAGGVTAVGVGGGVAGHQVGQKKGRREGFRRGAHIGYRVGGRRGYQAGRQATIRQLQDYAAQQKKAKPKTDPAPKEKAASFFPVALLYELS